MSRFDPTPEDLTSARSSFADGTRAYTERFVNEHAETLVLGMVQACLDSASETDHSDYADQCIRRARAYLVVLAEFRERGAQ